MEKHGLGYLRRPRSCYEGAAVDFGIVHDNLVEKKECLRHACGPYACINVETPVWFSDQRRGMRHSDGEMDWGREGLGTSDSYRS